MLDSESAPRKKIAFVITKANWGGAQRYVYDLAVAMQKAGYAVVVAYGTPGVLNERLAAAGIPTRELPHVERNIAMFAGGAPQAETIFASVSREFLALKELLAFIKEERPDVLHVNSSKVGGLGALAGRLRGVKRIVFTAHGWAFNERRPWWQKAVFYVLYTATILLSHLTICVSDAVRRDIRFIPFGRHVVIRHGMDAPDFMTKTKARAALLPEHKDAFWLGMVAELHPSKRVEDAIDMLAELKDSHPNLHLAVIGDGELREWLGKRAEHYGLGNRVHLLGFVPDAAKYLKAFDVFLMISRTEALGLALIEAGYAGLPVLAARAGGIPEVVKHKRTGVLVPRENPHTLALALRLLLESPGEMHAYGEALAEDTRARFSKEGMILKTIEAYGL